MFLSALANFYKHHEKLFIKLMNIFVFSHSKRTYIKTLLSYKDGPQTFLQRGRKLKTQNDKQHKFKYFLSAVAIIKNEGANLPEWIEYHRIIGIEKFYLYDNDSNDDTKKILAPYIKRGIVEYTFFPGDKQQIPAYNHFIKHYKKETKWAVIIDLDEFIVSKKESLINFLSKQNGIAQILIPWVFFGSNGHITKPNGLVIANYTKRAKKPRLYKSIVNPRLVLDMECHKHIVYGKTIFPKMDTIMINHYYCKSWQEYKLRANRGDALNGKKFAMQEFVKSNFDKFDTNDVYDPFILQYEPEIIKRIETHKKHLKP